MTRTRRNIGASIRARLLALARQTGQPFDVLLTRFVHERLLYRLSLSPHAEDFVLKGAMLLVAWLPHTGRGTRDLDLLGFGKADDQHLLGVFHEVLAITADDGVAFDLAALRLDPIREEQEYGGVRLRTTATVSGARIVVVVDVGFGDSIVPGIEIIEYPVLLDLPAPKLRTYARETVVAEKFQAMVMLGRANSRMKDFYDIWILSRIFPFAGDRLARAIAATFARRRTEVPMTVPDALTPEFGSDPGKQRQWAAFVADIEGAPRELQAVVTDLAAFLMPAVAAARGLF